MIIDIRDNNEYKKRNIDGSINIPERHLKDSIELLNTFDEVVFCCLSGLHARRIAHKYKDILKVKVDARRL
mgnify:FL=1